MEATIGLEVHVHLVTESKLFCGCGTGPEEPNVNTCPICLGYPGSKPMVNRRAIEQGVLVALALNCVLAPHVRFSRKSYFYPDMPKNYQITQYEEPLATGGCLKLGGRRIRVRRVHLEEDPAKLVHVGGDITGAKYTLIDYNRAGMPLVEIVTEPDLRDTGEARAFLEKLGLILEHLGVYDSSSEGALRVDANVSVEGGQRVEVKNITGFRNVERALIYEVVRQRSASAMGLDVSRETRHYDAESGATVSLRKKEMEDDYGYMVEPDLVRINLTPEWVDRIASGMPELPDMRIQRLVEQYGVSGFQSGVIVNAGLAMSRFYEECCALYGDPVRVASWLVTYLMKSLNYMGLSLRESRVEPRSFVELLELIDEGVISERLAKELIKEYAETGKSPRLLVDERGLGLMGPGELGPVVEAVVRENPRAVEDYAGGRVKAVEYLLGQVLRRVEARARPEQVRSLLLEELCKFGKLPR
ncbi:MAG: Asp-tRNA(Asn)/Glu-tRNA(Gln) amidotransferase subunit GatB [Candidatus Bathyarchaeota archaeon]